MVPDSASDNAHCCNPKIEDTPCQCASWVTVRASNLEGARSVHMHRVSLHIRWYTPYAVQCTTRPANGLKGDHVNNVESFKALHILWFIAVIIT